MYKLSLLFLLILFTLPSFAGEGVGVSALTCEYTTNPLGIENRSPRLSWLLDTEERGQRQTAYQILVASSPEKLTEAGADLWNTGQVRTDQSVHILYDGSPLSSRQRCYWKVKVWDKSGKASAFSEAAFWEMGLLEQDDWQGQWLAAVPSRDEIPPLVPAPHFRKEFITQGEVQSARLYIVGLGYYEAYLNGEKVGNHVLDPALTRYDKRVKYVVHDVTEQVQSGANALGVILGNGWYNQHTREAWDFDQAPWRDSPTLRCQLEITYAGGRREVINSGSDWKFSFGPIVFDGVHNGETYDARLELGNWSATGYDDSEWRSPFVVAGPKGKLTSQIMPPIRIISHLKPKSRQELRPGVFIYDLGQNMTGWARLSVSGPVGSEVVLRYGEQLNTDGSLDQKELSRFILTGETQTNRYLLKGGQEEMWHPRFTYHGFQYVEVSVSSPEVQILNFGADVVHTDLEKIGSFSSSNDMFNQLQHNIHWSFLGNFHGFPTDCPHREKMGWTGDAQLVAEVGLYNFDAVTAYLKWLDDFLDEQRPSGQVAAIIPTSGWGYTWGKGEGQERGHGPQWEGALVTIPWYLYQFTGDETILERYYPAMKAYVDYLSDHSENHLLSFGIDDHKQIPMITDGHILSSGYYYHLSVLLGDMAAILGKEQDSISYHSQADRIKKAFNEKYYDPSTGIYGVGGQTQLSEALFFGLAEPGEKQKVLDNLLQAIRARDGHIETGVLGTKFMVNSLLEQGQDRVLYEMAAKTDFPGWGYWVEQGATTLFQNWDTSQSQNHIMFGTIGDYFYKGLVGINVSPSSPGFKHIIIRPSLANDLTWAKGSHASPYGLISSFWEKDGQNLVLEVTIPANTTADVYLPDADLNTVRESGKRLRRAKGVSYVEQEQEAVRVRLGSGSYRFSFERKL